MKFFKGLLLVVGLIMGLILFARVQAWAQYRIVVVPFFIEEGAAGPQEEKSILERIKQLLRGQEAEYRVVSPRRDFRRAVNFINNQLVRHGFEVVNYKAMDLKEEEYNKLRERAREDSVLVSKDVCRRYATDLAYIVWLYVRAEKTAEGLCKVRVRLEGEGYDSAGRDLGAAVSKTFKVTRETCDDAVAEAEKEVADTVGRVLTAWAGRKPATKVASSSARATKVPASPPKVKPSPSTGGGVLERRAKALENLIMVRLEGVTRYEEAEVFGKVLNTVRGVVEAKRYRSRIVPDEPQASLVVWRVKIEGTDPFRLQANIIKMVQDILKAGGYVESYKGVPYRYSPAEVDMLKGLRPADCSSREIVFVIDRELARDREFEGRFDPYDRGFE